MNLYLSRLRFDSRNRAAAINLSRPYELHRTLLRAFPNAEQGGPGRVLFRTESTSMKRAPEATVIVQSEKEPDWIQAGREYPAGLLLALPECRTLPTTFAMGAVLRFRLRANPTKKTGTVLKSERLAMKERGTKDPKRHGRRVPVRAEDYDLDSKDTPLSITFHRWLEDRSQRHGFRLVEPLEDTLNAEAGYVYFNKTQDPSKGQRLRSVSYDGLLEIVDPARFSEALRGGIGPAKAFGFGLLSIAPVNP